MDRIASFKTDVSTLSRGSVVAAVFTALIAAVLLVTGLAGLFAWEPFVDLASYRDVPAWTVRLLGAVAVLAALASIGWPFLARPDSKGSLSFRRTQTA